MKNSGGTFRSSSIPVCLIRYGQLLLFLVVLAALTGGFGIGPPVIEGLANCTEFMQGRIMSAGIVSLMLCLLACGFVDGKVSVFAWTVCLSFISSILVNFGLGQDPIGAYLNWKVLTIDFDSVNVGSEVWRLYHITAEDWVSYDPESGEFISSGLYFNTWLPWSGH